MKKSAIILALALGVSAWSVTAQEEGGPPPSGERPPAHERGPGGPGGPGAKRGFHLLPPRAQDQLNLTAEQQKQVADLEAETKAKLEKILTADQLQQLKQMRSAQRPGSMNAGGPGGHGPGPAGGPGRPQRPPEE